MPLGKVPTCVPAKFRSVFVPVDRLIYTLAKREPISSCGGFDEPESFQALDCCRGNRVLAGGVCKPAILGSGPGDSASSTAAGRRVSATTASWRAAASRGGIPTTSAWRSAAAGCIPAPAGWSAASRCDGPGSKANARGLPRRLAAILLRRSVGWRRQAQMPEGTPSTIVEVMQSLSRVTARDVTSSQGVNQSTAARIDDRTGQMRRGRQRFTAVAGHRHA